jgi:hypothetical protein
MQHADSYARPAYRNQQRATGRQLQRLDDGPLPLAVLLAVSFMLTFSHSMYSCYDQKIIIYKTLGNIFLTHGKYNMYCLGLYTI